MSWTARFGLKSGSVPPLVGRKGAAQILGVQSPHITRYVEQGRVHPIPVDGGAPVYVRAEIEELAKEVKAERRERRAARKEGKR